MFGYMQKQYNGYYPFMRFEDPPAPSDATQQQAASQNSDGTDHKALYEAAMVTVNTNKADHDKQFTGLQQTYQKEQDAHKVTAGQVTKLSSQVNEFTKTINTVNETNSILLADKEKLAGENQKLVSDLARKTLIIEKFPQLASFEAKGTLPAAKEGEAYEVTLKNFSDSLAQFTKTSKQTSKDGETPDDVTPIGGAKTAKELKKEANELAMSGKNKEATAKFDEYYKQKAIEEGHGK